MTDIEKLNAEIARLTAERDALEKPPMSEAERWAREYRGCLRRQSHARWWGWANLGVSRRSDLIVAMQPVIDGIRAEADCALASMTAQRDRLKLKVDSQRDELKRWNDAHSMGPNQTRDKLVEQALQITGLIVERDALKTQVDALATRAAGLEAERDALAARVQHGGVEFDVTGNEFRRALSTDRSGDDFVKFAIRYLAEHATVVTPEPPGDLPTVGELRKIYWQSVDAHPTVSGCHVAGMTAVLAHLRPWLRPRAITRAEFEKAHTVWMSASGGMRPSLRAFLAAVGITVEVTP